MRAAFACFALFWSPDRDIFDLRNKKEWFELEKRILWVFAGSSLA